MLRKQHSNARRKQTALIILSLLFLHQILKIQTDLTSCKQQMFAFRHLERLQYYKRGHQSW